MKSRLRLFFSKLSRAFILTFFVLSVFNSQISFSNAQTSSGVTTADPAGGGSLTGAGGGNITDIVTGATTNTTTGDYELKEPRSVSVDPCRGVGTIWILGADRIGCEMWLFLTKFILQISAELAKLSADLFDYTTQKFVLQISTLFKTEETKDASGNVAPGKDKVYIYKGWSVIRDLANILAFFGAVYTGFRYITGSDGLDFKKAVTKFILYSILVNFSFPISKFLIDISNVFSLQIYGGITEYEIGASKFSQNILSSMNLNSLISQVGAVNPTFKGFTSFSLMWLAIIYLLSAFAVFLYAALTILVRSFILLACVVLSPLMFLNFAFPKLTELHEKWRENFFGQLMFAPILMFGFWLSFIFLQTATITSTVVVGEASVDSYSNVYQLINMLLAILALFLTVKMSSGVSGGVGKTVSGFVGGAMKSAGLAVATGGAGLITRQTLGRAGAALASSQWVKNTGKENGATRRVAASLISRTGNGMANMNVLDTKSYNEKNSGKINNLRNAFEKENGEKIKKNGMVDLFTQAKTKEEFEKATEEMDKRANDKNYKWNSDLYGRDAEKKNFKNNQADRKEAKEGNVADKNLPQFFQGKENLRRVESDEVKNLRAERIKKVKEVRDLNFIKAESDEDAYAAFKKKTISENKAVDFSYGKRIEQAKEKVNELNNTNEFYNKSFVAGAAVGKVVGDVANLFRSKKKKNHL